jgi:hypothetical protein
MSQLDKQNFSSFFSKQPSLTVCRRSFVFSNICPVDLISVALFFLSVLSNGRPTTARIQIIHFNLYASQQVLDIFSSSILNNHFNVYDINNQ